MKIVGRAVLVLTLSVAWSMLAMMNFGSNGAGILGAAQGPPPGPPQNVTPSPVCPERPLWVQPTEADVKRTGLSLEVLCLIGGTTLARDMLGPNDVDPDLLRRNLQEGPYSGLSRDAHIKVMREAVEKWPNSRLAHAGLARAILSEHRDWTVDEKRSAATAYVKAASIAFEEGRVVYGAELATLLGDLKDTAGIRWYLQRAFQLIPQESERYVLYLEFGRALGKAGDDENAERYLKAAVATRPGGIWEAYEYYASFLMERGRAADVLNLLSPSMADQGLIDASYLYTVRCRALQHLGRQAEADEECAKARDALPVGPDRGPAGIRRGGPQAGVLPSSSPSRDRHDVDGYVLCAAPSVGQHSGFRLSLLLSPRQGLVMGDADLAVLVSRGSISAVPLARRQLEVTDTDDRFQHGRQLLKAPVVGLESDRDHPRWPAGEFEP